MSFLLRPTLRTVPTLSTRAFSSTRALPYARMTIVGRLGTAPEAFEHANNPGGRVIVRYVLGTTTGRGDKTKTSWFRIASFVDGAQKDYLLGLPKGTLMCVDADARMDVYDDKEGKTQSSLSLVSSK